MIGRFAVAAYGLDGEAQLIYLHLDPGYEPLRGDPRYAEMVNRIGLR